MLKNFIQKALKRKKTSLLVIILILILGYFGVKALSGGKTQARYVLSTVSKGTLITSVSGSGQVTVLDQIDIKPKISGDITALYVNKDEEVKAGQLLAVLNSGAAQRAVSDADIALDGAKIKLGELISPPDAAQSLLQAENALAQAERDLEKAKESDETVETDAESALASAYEDGYSNVSTAFFKLSGYMKDLKDAIGTDQSAQEYITGYELILGKDSIFTQKLLADYNSALNLFNKNFTFFRTVFQDGDRDTIYQLILDTLKTTKVISSAIESARHMYDAVVLNESYKRLSIASQVDKMRPKIESDLSSVFSTINSLQQTINTINETVQDTPDKIKDAELALKFAQEKLEDKKIALEELKAGAGPLDIRTQQNIVAQKEAALVDAKENLANCYIRAPFDGVIAEVSKVKKGDSVSASTVLAILITQQKIAQLSLNEIDVVKIKVGQPATLTFDTIDGLSIVGQVAEVDTIGAVSQGVVTYGVQISFDTQDDRVKPGMSFSAAIISNARQDVLMAPNSAIKTSGNVSYVLVPAEKQADTALNNTSGVTLTIAPKQQIVQTGLSNDSYTEITSGLQEGDQIITKTTTSSTKSTTTTTQGQSLLQVGGAARSGGFMGR